MEFSVTSNGKDVGSPSSRQFRIEQLRKWKILKEVPHFVLERVKIASATSKCAFLITLDDSVFVVGDNHNGILGFDWKSIQHVPGKEPKRHDLLSRISVVEIAIGQGFALVRTVYGEVYSMGANYDGELGVGHRCGIIGPTKVLGLEEYRIVKIRCGSLHSVCITSEGQVFAWGPCSFGRVGPQAVLNVHCPKLVEFPGGVDIGSVACTEKSTFAWTSGKVYGWGSNANGELGDDSKEDASVPKEIKFPDGVNIKKVVCGATHCIALATDSSMYAWGRDFSSEIDNVSQFISAPTKLTWMPDRVLDVESNWRGRATLSRTRSGVYAVGDFKSKKLLIPRKTEYDDLAEAFADDSSCMYENWDCYREASSTNSRSRPRAELKEAETVEDDGTCNVIEFIVEGKIVRGWKPTLENCKRLEEELKKYDDGACTGNGAHPLEIKNFGFEEFRAFIRYLHTGSLEMDDARLIELVALADDYQEKELRRIGLTRLSEIIQVDNATDIYNTALKYGDLELRISSLAFIASNLWEIMQNPKFLRTESLESVGGSIIRDLIQMKILETSKGKDNDRESSRNEAKATESRPSTTEASKLIQFASCPPGGGDVASDKLEFEAQSSEESVQISMQADSFNMDISAV